MARVKKKSRGLEKTYLTYAVYELLAYILASVSIYLGFEISYVFLIFVPIGVTFAFFMRHKRAIISGGLRGERNSRKLFKKLPKHYKVLQSVPLDVAGKMGEIDFLIVGKKMVFLIETKNLNGKIYGNPMDDYLIKDKWVKGKVVRDKVKNPSKQVARTERLLRKQLKPEKVKIVPIILSIHPKAEWEIGFESVSILDEATVIDEILSMEKGYEVDLAFQKKVLALL